MSYIFKPAKGTAWRTKVLKNLLSDVIIYGKIETSLPLAHSLTSLLAKLITWSKENTLHSRRLALRYITTKKHLGVLDKLFSPEMQRKYADRNGGYTRITKLYYRRGDNNLRVQISLL